MIRRYAAHYVFPGNTAPVKNGIVEVDNGVIVNLFGKARFREMANMEFFNGIICPSLEPVFTGVELELLLDKVPELSAFRHLFAGEPFEWLKAISLNFKLPLDQLLYLFCYKIAVTFDRLNSCGTLEPGKQPGISVIDNVDFNTMRLQKNSRMILVTC